MLSDTLRITVYIYNSTINKKANTNNNKFIFPLLGINDTSFNNTVVKRLYAAKFKYHYEFEDNGVALSDIVVFDISNFNY